MLKQYLRSLARRLLNRIVLSEYGPEDMPVLLKKKRRLSPVSRQFGFDRGLPVDRYYIESFLEQQRSCVRGSVLEIGDNHYTMRFGDKANLSSHVLHAVSGNPDATIVGNLETGENVPHESFDCIICTQTFLCIYDVGRAVTNAFHALKGNGVLLATVPGISQISRYDMDRWGDFWRFTDASARRLFGDVFGAQNTDVKTYGNVLSACAFLNGFAAEEFKKEDLDFVDRDYQVVIAVKAVKA